jgi:hypothetical protein
VTLLVDGHVMQSQDVGNEVQWVDFDDIDRTASRVRLRFDETWVGEEWNDLAISEVQVYVSEQ